MSLNDYLVDASKEMRKVLAKNKLTISDDKIEIKIIDSSNFNEDLKILLQPLLYNSYLEYKKKWPHLIPKGINALKSVEKDFYTIKNNIALIAMKQGKPIGITIVSKHPKNKKLLKTDLVYIVPGFRKLGVSKKLARKAMYIIRALKKGHATGFEDKEDSFAARNSRVRMWQKNISPLPRRRFDGMKKEDYIKRAKSKGF